MTELQRKHSLARCESCPLADRPFVASYIPEGATLAVVGAAPSYDDAKQGLPLTGVSGQLLERVSTHLGVSFDRVARLNAVLCHPYGNEQPSEQALRCCAPRLRAELAELPDLPLVTMGAVGTQALDALTGEEHSEGITKRRGNWYELTEDRRYLATLHPDYVIRNPAQVRLLIDDLAKALRDHKSAERDWLATEILVATPELWPSVRAILDAIPNGAPVAYDTETGGLQWWDTYERKGVPLLCVVIADRIDRAIIIPAETFYLEGDTVIDYLEGFFNRVYPIAHNAKFDELILRRDDLWINTAFDTMLASFALNEIKGYNGLKYLATALLNVPDYETIVLGAEFLNLPSDKRNYANLAPDRLYKYAGIDGVATLAIYYILKDRLIEDEVEPAFDVLMSGHRVATEAGWWGFKVDTDYLTALGEVLEDQKVELVQALWQVVQTAADDQKIVIGAPYYKNAVELVEPYGSAGVAKGTKPFNPGSVDQCAYVLYELLQLKPTQPLGYRAKEGSTGDEVLSALPPHPFVRGLQQYRTITKLLSTYVNTMLRLADTDDRIHINFNLNGTETGRLSADDSQHGIPRATDFYGQALRGSYVAAEGYKLVIGDYSQAELRAIAAESGERFFLDAFNMPLEERHRVAAERYGAKYADASDKQKAALAKLATDVHSRTATFLFDTYEGLELRAILEGDKQAADVAKELRTFAKNFNFGNVYQGGVSGIWSMTGGKLPKPRVAELLHTYHAKTPTLQAYCKQQFRRAKADGYVKTRMGRKRRFPLLVFDNIDEVKKASVNMPIQSMASDLTLLSAYELSAMGYRVVHMIHDSIILEVLTGSTDLAVKHMNNVMVRTGARYFPEVEWEVDIDVADRWHQKRPNLRLDLPAVSLKG